MTTILYIKDADTYQNRRKLAGAAAYTKAHRWNLQAVVCPSNAEEITDLINLWHPMGIIVNAGSTAGVPPPRISSRIPTLYFQDPERTHDCIGCDSVAIARHAARELLELDLTTYAYLPWFNKAAWSDIRQTTYATILAAHGRMAHTLDLPPETASTSVLIRKIADGLKRLPRPAGLFAANDRMAELAVSACRLANLTVPDDVAIVGVDDDMETCEASSPTLSSVSFDYYAAGQLAAETLADMIAHPSRKRVCVTYQPLGITRRESTRRFEQKDATVSAALERIRREACLGVSSADICASFPCSRRLAEMRFRRATGRSILEEIRAVRLTKAKELIREGRHKLDYVANLSGFNSLAAFSAFFKAETGVLPSHWTPS